MLPESTQIVRARCQRVRPRRAARLAVVTQVDQDVAKIRAPLGELLDEAAEVLPGAESPVQHERQPLGACCVYHPMR
jgi:hypothetical protein